MSKATMLAAPDIVSRYKPLLRHGDAVSLLADLGLRDCKALLARLAADATVKTTRLRDGGRAYYHRDSIAAAILPKP